jgi:GNAT superfamily N-acetyltransferase
MSGARFDAFWPAMAAILGAGETYALDPALDREAARSLWCDAPQRTYAAVDDDGTVLGSYYLKPNAAGGGARVCNCGYMTAPEARGRGVASALCVHSQEVARDLGYRAMQFNAVVATNVGAVRLWQRHGFAIVGTVPGAFHHPRHGDVDVHVMHKALG